MLDVTQKAAQYANPFVVKALTKLHGVYVNVYNKIESDLYDEGRDNYISNPYNYEDTPTYSKIQLLLNKPVQYTFSSGEESFDSYMEDLFFITCEKKYQFDKLQKFEVFYNKNQKTPVRTFQCFEVREYSNSYNSWTVRHLLLKSFN